MTDVSISDPFPKPSPTLSLCIPTYNRAALLSQSLRAILSQITPDMNSAVEVVTLDNASPDDTPAVIAQAQRDFPHVTLRAVRRPQNIGCDANFCDAPNQARGAWVYLLSDDDVLLPGAVAALLGLIAAHPDVDAFALNIRQFWQTPDEVREGAYAIPEDLLLPDRDAALVFLGTHITFLSCIAFRRASVAGRDYASRYHTNLAQAYMFLDALAPGHGLYATRDCFLAQRAGNNEGYEFYKVFVTHFAQMMEHAERAGYARRTIRRIQARHLRLLFSFSLIFKVRGSYGTLRPDFHDSIARMWRAYGLHPYFLGVLLPLLLLPAPVVALVRTTARGLKAKILRRPLAPSLADPS